MRIALPGSEDVLELRQINGTWVTDDCEPVHLEYAWMRNSLLDDISEDNCICSPELAARLLHLLFSGESEPDAKAPAATRAFQPPVYHHLI